MKYLALQVTNNTPCTPYQDKDGNTIDSIPSVLAEFRNSDDDFECPICNTQCSEHDIKFDDDGDMFYRVCDYFDDPEYVEKFAGTGRPTVSEESWTVVYKPKK